jgi:hypothetical protein
MATRNITPTSLINLATKAGKKFVNGVERLKNELLNSQPNENTRFYKQLTDEQIHANPFLHTVLNNIKNSGDKELQNFFKCLELKTIHIGEFGRKAGYNHYPIEEPYFRFVVHLGSPEVFYINDKPVALLNGHGFVISPAETNKTHFTVYNGHIRLISDPHVQAIVSKIRPKDYKRTILIYDYAFNFPTEDENTESHSESPVENSENAVENSESPVENSESPVEKSENAVENSENVPETHVENSESPVENSESPVENSETPLQNSENVPV